MSAKNPDSSAHEAKKKEVVSSDLTASVDDVKLLEDAEEKPVSYLFILLASALMLLAVWAFMQVLHQATEQKPHPNTLTATHQTGSDAPVPGSTLVAMPVAPASVQVGAAVIHDKRTLRRFYQGRAYLGAPPMVPHPIAEQHGNVENCLACHEQGGYVPKYQAYAPVTPHPTYRNCVQCHVSPVRKTLFRPTTWVRYQPPQLRRTPLAGGPPPIPHGLQLRTNCNACHAGPGSVREIRTPHPERTNCLQCHVPRMRVAAFVSRYQPVLSTMAVPSRVPVAPRTQPESRRK